jgi:ABC-type Fe3+/spermidine/putrescine transport system ATPase subunit
MTGAASVELTGLTKRYGSMLAVDSISLRLEPGKLLALLGPSGSGKSTMLNLIAGFEQPDTGSIRIAGRDVVGLPPERRGVGIVFQSYALFPHMTVGENLAYPLHRRRIASNEIARRIAGALELVRLGGLSGRSVTQLSGGQQQRVALARALIADPEILLLDEPMAALDRALRDDLQVELRQLQQRLGSTVILVTHDQSEALALADRVGILNRGVLQQEGPVREVFEQPASAFVAQFLGGASLLNGVVEIADGTLTLKLRNGFCLPGRWAGRQRPEQGGPAQLAIRPAHVALRQGGGGRVIASVYAGDATLLHVRLDDGSVLLARDGAGLPPSIGDAVSVDWLPDKATIYPTHMEASP